MMFATFILERDFPIFADLPGILLDWVRVAGAISIFALLVLVALRTSLGRGKVWTHGLSGMLDRGDPGQAWKLNVLLAVGGLALLGVVFFAGLFLYYVAVGQDPFEEFGKKPALGWGWTAVSGAALFALSWEFLLGLADLSPRRLWAIARFSMVEAMRKKVLWGFGLLLLVFLFGSWFISSSRADTQWSAYVNLVFFILAALTLVTASTVACFSIPTDIKNQSIHTIVTKPVQKFEIVLGRILGLSLLMTLALGVAGLLSLLYIVRGVDDKVRQTAIRARQPLFGSLQYEELNPVTGEWARKDLGEFIGREFDLRQYIRGGSNQEAVWRFRGDLDPKVRGAFARLAARPKVNVEFAFDIFRTSKGGIEQYKEGVDVQFAFINRTKWNDSRYGDFREAKDASGLPLSAEEKARKFGYFEPRPLSVTDEKADYDRIQVPGALFEGLENGGVFEIRLGCRSYAQYLGCYKYDLYILDDEGAFLLNFLKGLSGLWFFMVLVVVLGVVASSYLNAPVSLMLVWLVMLLGTPQVRGFLYTLTIDPSTENPGGNALESAYRLLGKQSLTTPLDESGAVRFLQGVDKYVLKYVFKALYMVIPDLGQYSRTMYVAEGFNIPGDELGMSFVLMGLYLFPFLLLGFYFMNLREIAG